MKLQELLAVLDLAPFYNVSKNKSKELKNYTTDSNIVIHCDYHFRSYSWYLWLLAFAMHFSTNCMYNCKVGKLYSMTMKDTHQYDSQIVQGMNKKYKPTLEIQSTNYINAVLVKLWKKVRITRN